MLNRDEFASAFSEIETFAVQVMRKYNGTLDDFLAVLADIIEANKQKQKQKERNGN